MFIRSYLIPRLIQYILVILFGVTAVFIIPRLLPNDPVMRTIGELRSRGASLEPGAMDKIIADMTQMYGLEGSWLDQYGAFWARLARGDLGVSFFQFPTPVLRLILTALPWTVGLAVPTALLDRIEQTFGARITPEEAVRRILADVRSRGDAALIEWSQRVDGVTPPSLVVDAATVRAAYAAVDPTVVAAMRHAVARVERFHRRQPSLSWIHNDAEGTLGQLVRPIDRIGIYIPGGSAPLPSSLIMTAACPIPPF